MQGESTIPLTAGSESVAALPSSCEEGYLIADVCRRQGWSVSEVRIRCESEGQRSEVTTLFKTLGFETAPAGSE